MRVFLLPLVLLLVALWLLWNDKAPRWLGGSVLVVALVLFAWAALDMARFQALLGGSP